MPTLDNLFNPQSIAVIGASNKKNSVGASVFHNLLAGKFKGKLFPVNLQHKKIQGQKCYASINNIEGDIDLAVIVTPAATVPALIKACGLKGVKNAIVISAGFSEVGKAGKKLEEQMLAYAQKYQVRIVGPNCLGVMRPHLKMNATFDNHLPMAGDIALVSQSGAICAAILDWARDKKIGFSTIASLGNSPDVGFGEILEYLAFDQKTKSILLYIEGVHLPQKFMSGLRAVSSVKPVIVIKAGRNAQGSRAVHSHTGALIGDDDVFDAAIQRGGAIRVKSIEQLFDAAQVLSGQKLSAGNRLTIITNGGGAGVLAADHAAELNLELTTLSKATIKQLDKFLPQQWSHQNPIDILGDAKADRYAKVIEYCSQDKNTDGIVVLLVPVAVAEPSKVANEMVKIDKKTAKPILASWMGGTDVMAARSIFAKNKIPSFDTPEPAVEAFSYLADYRRNQTLLKQMPERMIENHDLKTVRHIIDHAAHGNKILTSFESKKILAAFGIPTVETKEATTADETANVAKALGFPVVIKIDSPDITHKKDVGGVQLNIADSSAAKEAFTQMMRSVKSKCPEANVLGVTVEQMCKTPNDRELMIGVIQDKVFGPIISFGIGGSLVEIIHDRAIGLPPLNDYLARQMIAKTKAAKWLAPFRGMAPANIDAIMNVLLCISDLICEFGEICELDINPLIANDKGVIAVDARIVIAAKPKESSTFSHLAIHPYPKNLETHCHLAKGLNILIRPIRPEDAINADKFIQQLSKQSKYFLFRGALTELSQDMLIRLTQIDYEKEMAIVAVTQHKNKETMLGLARYAVMEDGTSAEFALMVADAAQHKGVGTTLLKHLFAIAKESGLKRMEGLVWMKNKKMLDLVKYLGLTIEDTDKHDVKRVVYLNK